MAATRITLEHFENYRNAKQGIKLAALYKDVHALKRDTEGVLYLKEIERVTPVISRISANIAIQTAICIDRYLSKKP